MKILWLKETLEHLGKRMFGRKKAFVYVALGDSTCEGIGATDSSRSYPNLVHLWVKQEYKKVQFHNLGKSGAKLEDVLKNQTEKAILLKPDLITISVGGNDLLRMTKRSKFRNELNQLLLLLKQKTDALVIINNIPDIAFAKAIPFAGRVYFKYWLRRFNRIIKEQAALARTILVDLYSPSKVFLKRYPEFFSKDRLHPSDAGYALWANTIIFQIRTSLTFPNKLRISN